MASDILRDQLHPKQVLSDHEFRSNSRSLIFRHLLSRNKVALWHSGSKLLSYVESLAAQLHMALSYYENLKDSNVVAGILTRYQYPHLLDKEAVQCCEWVGSSLMGIG